MHALATALKNVGLPLDAIDSSFLSENERCDFYRACRKLGVKHSEEVAHVAAPMDSRDLARANID